jgi:hypothetical protein
LPLMQIITQPYLTQNNEFLIDPTTIGDYIRLYYNDTGAAITVIIDNGGMMWCPQANQFTLQPNATFTLYVNPSYHFYYTP